MHSPPITDSISEIHMSLSCLVAEICGLKFPSWPSKSSRIDAIHRKIVSSCELHCLSMCFTSGSIVMQ